MQINSSISVEIAAMQILDSFHSAGIDMRDGYDPMALAYLERHGYAEMERTISDHVGVIPTSAGHVELSKFKARRDDRVERALNLRNSYLRFIRDQEEQSGAATPDSFLATGPNWLGSPYTADEVERVGAWLKNAGLISGPGAWGYDGPLRPQLTIEGRDVIESGRSVNERTTAGTTAYNTTISGGNVNLAQGSANVSQHQGNRTAADAALAIATTVLDRLHEIDLGHRTAVRADVEELQAEAQGQRRSQALPDLGTKVLTSVATSGAGQLVAAIGPLLQELTKHATP